VSCGIGNQSASRSTWYDDDNAETLTETNVDRLIDSGHGTLKKCSGKTIDESSGTTEIPASVTVQNQQPESAVRVAASGMKETTKTEGIAKQKKKLKNEESRHLRRVADAGTSERRGKEVVGERQKSIKATSKTCELQNRRTEQRPTSTSAQPHRRELPKIVVNGKAHEDDDAGVENSEQTASSRQAVHANTDPNIAMVTLDVRTKVATAFADSDENNDEGASRNPKVDGESGLGQQTVGRPLPPVGKRRRAASESSAMTVLSDAHRSNTGTSQ